MDVSHDSKQFSLKHTWKGYVAIVRWAVPDEAPGVWVWSRWHRVDRVYLGEVMKRLSNG